MSHKLLKMIETKLDQAFSEIWPNRPPIQAVLDEGTRYDPDIGGVIGGVTFSAFSRRNNEWAIVHKEPMSVLKSEVDVDDWLAKGLSTLLMLHTRWPK